MESNMNENMMIFKTFIINVVLFTLGIISVLGALKGIAYFTGDVKYGVWTLLGCFTLWFVWQMSVSQHERKMFLKGAFTPHDKD